MSLRKSIRQAIHGPKAPLAECDRCPLRPRPFVSSVLVPGSKLFFVGEAPGEVEVRRGEPFVGPAGQKLNKIMKSLRIDRRDISISNTVLCRPQNNRNPDFDEIDSCSARLRDEIGRVGPKLVVALGGVAAQALTGTRSPVKALRGQGIREFGERSSLMVTWHPAYILRNPAVEDELRNDLAAAYALAEAMP